MTFQEGDQKAHEIAARLARLPRNKRNETLDAELSLFKSGERSTLLSTIPLILAEIEKRARPNGLFDKVAKMDHNLLFKVIGFGLGVIALIVVVFLAVNIPAPTPFQYFVFRCIMSLGVASFTMGLTGFFAIKTKLGATTITAGSSIGIFVYIYSLNPASLLNIK